MAKGLSFIVLVGILFVGFATGPSYGKDFEGKEPQTKLAGPEEQGRIVAQTIPSEKGENGPEQLRSLDKSISVLRSEVAELKEQLKRIQSRPPLATYKVPEVVSICGEKIPLEDRKVWETLDQEFLVALGNEVQVLLWMKRARRYFPHVERRLKEMFLPDDLKYLAITESSLRPYVVSPSGAAGIWQFIPATGERYGMRGNRGIDERFDFFKATEGALAYLKALYEEFNSWPLAMAAYNVGENRIRREIALQRTSNYFYLDLPMETERYVYKIAVAKIVLSNPAKYGFSLEEKEFYDPLQVERVQIELPLSLPIIDVAAATGYPYKDIKEMNLHLTGDAIPTGVQTVNLPLGSSERFQTFFDHWKKKCDPQKVRPKEKD